jgi:hypothetical protein
MKIKLQFLTKHQVILLFMATMSASHAYQTKGFHSDEGLNCSLLECETM